VSGNIDCSSNLFVNKNTTIYGNLDVSGNIDCSSNLFVNKNTTIYGNLDVSGNIDCSSNLFVNNNTTIYGNLDVSGNIDCSSNLTVNLDVNIGGKMGIIGDIDCSSNIYANYMYLTSGKNYSSDDNAVMPKSYIDTVNAGLNPTQTCLCATTNNVDLSYTSAPLSSSLDGINISSYDDGSYNILVINQESSSITQTASIDNGVWILSKTGSVYSWIRPTTPEPMYVGYDAVGSFSFVTDGDSYGGKALVQIINPCIIGTNQLKYQIFYQLKFGIGRGLSLAKEGSENVLIVDTSLNFINFLDSDTSDPSANGILSIGTKTTNKIIIGPTGPTGSNIPLNIQTICNGQTGNFTYLSASNGITGPTGSFTYLNSSTGTFTYLNSGTGTFTYLDATYYNIDSLNVKNSISCETVAIGKTGVTLGYVLDVSGNSLFSNDIKVNSINIGLGGGSVTTNTAVGNQALQSNTSGQNNTAIGYKSGLGNTGGSYNTYLGSLADTSGNYSNSTALGYNSRITASNQIMLGGLTGGSYPQVFAPGGFTGPTGSFSNLIVSGKVGIGNSNPFYALDVSGNANVSGTTTSTNIAIGKTSLTGGYVLDVSGNAIVSGNIGIGNSNPSHKLDVSGNANVSGTTTSTNIAIG
ncbi:MAG: hypothetical protein ACOVOV_06625, partial [Dolichospermum sp.]